MFWDQYLEELRGSCKNYILLGEAGSGKSEIAMNLAVQLAKLEDRPVHFFDMDMTKPLFRSRDLAEQLTALGVEFHYEVQFMDAPTQVGGVNRLLRDPESIVVMDVGGDYIGARAVGGYAPRLNEAHTTVFYVVNPYRPWSYDIDHIDGTLGRILNVSHVRLDKLRYIVNPNNGHFTTVQEFAEGNRRALEMLSPYCEVDFTCVRRELAEAAAAETELPLLPLDLYITYPWLQE